MSVSTKLLPSRVARGCAADAPSPSLPSPAGYSILHFDEFIDQLLTEDRVCDVILPRLTKRDVLEETEGLAPRTSVLEDALEGAEASGSEDGGRHRSDGARAKGKGRADGSDVEMADNSDDEAAGAHRRRARSRSRSSDGASDEDGGRFISRSPSPRMRDSRSRSRSVSSAASDASWRSRSRSISPDRLERMMAEAVGEGRWKAAATGEGDDDAEAIEADDRVEGDV
jgi:pre-mRNA-splicing factor 38A